MSLVNNSNSIGVGNYKGVMLCNRPFAGSVATAGKSAPEKTSFTCGVVADSAGTNVSISNLEKKYPKRKKKETALTKHRKWLAELQNTKDRLESQYEEEMRATQEKNEKFQSREAAVRQVSKDTLQKAESKSPGAKSKKVKMPKPAWAMTAETAEVAVEEKEQNDEDELMQFAKGLDFDKYIDDLEIKTMMDKVQARIMELEKASSEERMRDEEAEQRAVARAMMEAKGEEDPDMFEAEGKSDAYDEAYAAAKGLLAESDALKGIHSTKSIAQVVRSNKDAKGGDDKPSGEPKIVTHQDDDGARLENKQNPSNLPYIHRNPAV